MEKRIGVYICSGCGIGEAMDAGKLAEVAGEGSVAAVSGRIIAALKK